MNVGQWVKCVRGKAGRNGNTGLLTFKAHPSRMAKASVSCGWKNLYVFICMQQTHRFQRQTLLVRIGIKVLKGRGFLCEQLELGTSNICVFVSVIFNFCSCLGGISGIFTYITVSLYQTTFLNAETRSYLPWLVILDQKSHVKVVRKYLSDNQVCKNLKHLV